MESHRLRFVAFMVLVPAAVAFGDARYFGLAIPDKPKPFQPPPTASLKAANASYSPDFSRFVFTIVEDSGKGAVVVSVRESRRDGSGWSPPEPILDAAGYNTTEASYTRDGRWVYFASNRPPGAAPWRLHVFRAPVHDKGLGPVDPVDVAPPANGGMFYPQILRDGALSFTSRSARGDDDLFVAALAGERFGQPEALAGDFNSAADDWDLVEDRAGRLRLWASARPGGAGKTDIYMSRREAGGEWSAARSVQAINTADLETAPRLSPDDRVLFFQRRSAGVEQIYWVRLDAVIE